ncbi:sulfotransferase [Longibacter sp.]|jgi:hypothetical protein|uniref:sulfotransferase n=1 Tax=Longibacter sp. TaxID=2045415 RepID=UPI003EB6D148
MIIVQGVFRSGTTLLFRTLRQAPRLRCYYEPLHPNLLDHVAEAHSQAPNHRKSSLYSEYAALNGHLRKRFDPRLCDERSVTLNGGQGCPRLRSYLNLLAASGPNGADEGGRVVLQFNRAFWMARWLRTQFPDTCFLHVVRDPRSVVWSQLTTSSCQRVRMDWPLLSRRFFNVSSGDLSNVFSPYAYHGVYQIKHYLALGRAELKQGSDAACQFAHELLESVEGKRPYVQALALWGAQVWVCHHHARAAYGDRYALIRYEDFVRDPCSSLRSLFERAGTPPPDAARRFAKESVRPKRVARWSTVPTATERFREGIRRAGIEKVLDTVGYSLSEP